MQFDFPCCSYLILFYVKCPASVKYNGTNLSFRNKSEISNMNKYGMPLTESEASN